MEAETLKAKVKQKRIRKAPYRKWSEWEQQQLVNFLRQNRPIEKPSAQLYYKRFLSENGLEIEWSTVRSKVKNLKHTYNKTWNNSTGAGTMRDGETTRDTLLRECPLYNELEEIFGYREHQANAFVLDSEDSNTMEYSTASVDDGSPNIVLAPTEDTSRSPAAFYEIVEESATLVETPRTTAQTPLVPRKGIYSRTALADVLEVHSTLAEFKKEKLVAEKELRERELLLKEKEFNLKKEKHATYERLKLLELESKEKIAMKEIEMRERVEMEKLKIQK
ncbi:PREDICTED: uncharacterized protein LOC108381164 [Rhagoletis zephyria]|uniref:uncharacterized protein LOC108381164 n=1 Tax=Rhagoletis zephyria TaxID=28612 RepID=UPI00081166B3|nr:PREDICTED: uncharacterized protein LOC108381164 [Rhagoletis zephyria]